MNRNWMGFVCFAAGSAAGFMTAQKLLKDKYEQLVQDEIDSVKAVFCKHGTVKGDKPVETKADAAAPKVSNQEKIN